jgi:1-acyl-sn-glycerol-3-phosphate acyltransferase
MTANAVLPDTISAAGRLRIFIRLLAMVLLLLVCLILHYIWRLAVILHLTRRSPWPRVFLAGLGWLAGVEIKVLGERPSRGAFLIANHVSWMDIPALAGLTGTAFVAHDGLAAIPALRWLCELNDTVFIARHDRLSVGHQVEQVRAAVHETGALTIFPEGTTSDGTGLLPFKSSLLSAIEPVPDGIAVHPVLLDYGPESAMLAWIDDDPGVDNFMRILARSRPVTLTIHLLPALSGAALEGRKTMAAAACEALLAARDQRVTL